MSETDVRRIMDDMPYGEYIVGSCGDGEVNGMIADWVMQVSFNPRLLAVSFENDAHTLANVKANRMFTVNLITESREGMTLAAHFAEPYDDAKILGRCAGGVHHKLDCVPFTTTD